MQIARVILSAVMNDGSNPPRGGWGATQGDQGEDDGSTVTLSKYTPAARPALPFGGAPQPAAPPAPAPPPSVPAAVPPAWSAAQAGPASVPVPASPWASPRAPMPSAVAQAPQPPLADQPPPSRHGALGISNAAAAATAPWSVPRAPAPQPVALVEREPEPATSEAREVLRLVWFDEAAVPRIRRVPRWKPVLDALDAGPLDRELDDPAGEPDPLIVEDRREVFEIAARATPTDARGVNTALQGAIRADGKFVPPLVLVAGELETPFDEIAQLEATIAVATPAATSDDRELESSLQTARRFLENRGAASARAMARSLATRIREAFAREKKLAPEQLDEHVNRALREERSFQRREVLGDKHLRLLLRAPSSDASAGAKEAPLVVYAPEAVAKKLPMYARFAARIIAEVHLQEDESESAPAALKVLALVRRATAPRPT